MGGSARSCGWNAALVAGLALVSCGGVTERPKEDPASSGSGGRLATGGTPSVTGGRLEIGGNASAEATGGAPPTGSGKGSAGEFPLGGFGGTGTGSRLCEYPRARTNSYGEPTGVESCVAGGDHRVSVEECVIRLPRDVEPCRRDPALDSCVIDADCTEGPYGTCNSHGGGFGCTCDYGCRSDSDCADGGVCICGEETGACVPATCRTDADCEPSYQCRAFKDPNNPICTTPRFECQTPDDLCNENAHCPPLSSETCVADESGVHRCVFFSCLFP